MPREAAYDPIPRVSRHRLGRISRRFAAGVLVLALAYLAVTWLTGTTLPLPLVLVLRSAPYLILAAGVLIRALPKDTLRARGYVALVPLLALSVGAYAAVYWSLSLVMPSITQHIDIWSLQALPLYALRPLALGLALAVCFAVSWLAAFGFPPVKKFYRRWSGLALLPVLLALCVLLAYFHMVNYAQIGNHHVYAMFFDTGVPATAFWYRLPAWASLAIYWATEPLEALVMGGFLLIVLRTLRVRYPQGAEA